MTDVEIPDSPFRKDNVKRTLLRYMMRNPNRFENYQTAQHFVSQLQGCEYPEKRLFNFKLASSLTKKFKTRQDILEGFPNALVLTVYNINQQGESSRKYFNARALEWIQNEVLPSVFQLSTSEVAEEREALSERFNIQSCKRKKAPKNRRMRRRMKEVVYANGSSSCEDEDLGEIVEGFVQSQRLKKGARPRKFTEGKPVNRSPYPSSTKARKVVPAPKTPEVVEAIPSNYTHKGTRSHKALSGDNVFLKL